MKKKNYSCEICNSDDWEIIYKGKIRDGSFGKYKEKTSIAECNVCGVQRLNENDCLPPDYYSSGEYRKKLLQSLNNEKAVAEQDIIQKYMIKAIGGIEKLRNQCIIDVGCGAGSLLDMTSGITNSQIGVEPCQPYLNALQGKGYQVYPDLSSALKEKSQTIDWALSSQVIEHVKDPVYFLKEIFGLLKPGGRALVSTPNRNDILNNLLPEFREFFYRTQHRWYFDKPSLEYCAKKSGFEIVDIKHIHRYGMANALHWLRDNKPKGNLRLKEINEHADVLWSAYLQNTGQTDNIFCLLNRPS